MCHFGDCASLGVLVFVIRYVGGFSLLEAARSSYADIGNSGRCQIVVPQCASLERGEELWSED